MIKGTPGYRPWHEDPDPPDYWGDEEYAEMRRRLRAHWGTETRDKSWREEDHPRGQPENKGQFGPGGGGGSSTKTAKTARVPKGKPKRSGVSGKEATAAEALAAASARRAGKKAGADGHPGEGYSKHAKVVDGVIHTSDVEDAAKALQEHRKVELDQPRGVSVLLTRLGEVADKMIAKGEKAPTINLCNLTVKGSNLFCAGNMGKTRDTMPQMDEDQTKGFIKFLQGKGYTVKEEEQYASHLRATQNELNGVKIAGIAKAIRENQFDPTKTRTVISDDDYVLDGHHRWAAKVGNDSHDNILTNDSKYPVSRIGISITKLLEEAEIFTGGKGKKGVGEGTETPQQVQEKKKVKDATWREDLHPRGQPENKGQFGPGGGGSAKPARKPGSEAPPRAATKTGASAAEVLAASRTRTEKPGATAKRRDKLRSETGRTGPSDDQTEHVASARALVERAQLAGRSVSEQHEHELAEGMATVSEAAASRARLEERQAEINARAPVTSAEERRRAAMEQAREGGWQRHPEGGYQLAEPRGLTREENARWAVEQAEAVERLEGARTAEQVIAAGTSAMPPVEEAAAAKEAAEAAKTKKPTAKEDFDKAGIRLNTYSGEEEDALDDWNRFIGIPPEEFQKQFLGGLKGKIAINADPTNDKFSIAGKFEGEGKFKGQYVGSFDRVMDLRKKEAKSALFEIVKDAQGEGYGKQFLAGNIAMYEAAGITRVDVTAGLTVGGYAWAKYGYVPRKDDWDSIRASMKRQVGGGESRSSRSSSSEEVEASDWSELGGDRQDEVRQQWYRESHSEFVDSEIDNWRESGQPLEEAKKNLAEEFNSSGSMEWAEDALKDAREAQRNGDLPDFPFTDEQLMSAITVEYSSRYDDGNGDLTVEWNDDKLAKPEGIDRKQKTLPGIDKIEPHEYLTEDMRTNIERRMNNRFNSKAEDAADSADAPSYIDDQVSEYQDEFWDSMDDSERLRIAERYGLNTYEIESEEEEEEEPEPDPGLSADEAMERALLDALNSSNPKSIWKVADHPRGNSLLRRQGWSGTLDLKDPESYRRFKEYVAKPRKKDADAARRY